MIPGKNALMSKTTRNMYKWVKPKHRRKHNPRTTGNNLDSENPNNTPLTYKATSTNTSGINKLK
jgi:hypothetical protein